MLKITLDTCEIIIENASPLLARVKELALHGKVDIATTTMVIADKDQDKDPNRKARHLAALEEYPQVGTAARCGFSLCGSGDFCSGGDVELQIERIVFGEINPSDKHSHNKWADVDHLYGHYRIGRDIFVTEDTAILKKASKLKNELGIQVENIEILLSRFD